ncbi:ABC transporter substrate-binding protein [Limibaculum sp. M0105]|uniref:ABC transporter substrate-binding protein n=1 Tax=Thermohalobaculum xanthum TaxID=2753746 RepID=A0A8J7SFG3_9RHOB|nr:ABC transporter substrate-binding protein [Thermohalobaculum xanthum]MBK0399522.1 ABC transporter substrate-binding protein [Thermohalobaculum xanthum]
MGRHSRILAAIGLSLALVTGPALAQQSGGTLVQVTVPEPPNLASYLSTSGPIGQVAAKVYEGLIDVGDGLTLKPSLAESWTVSEDGKTITFKLREGVTWHDGKPFTSADVQYGIMNVLREVHPRGGATLKVIEAVETPDDYTAVFKLSEPAPYLMISLNGYESPIVAKHLFEGTDPRENPTANAPVGTGPFKFVEWQKGQFVRLDKNENYWQEGKPYLDRVVVRFIADASTRTAAIENGEVHFGAFGAIPNIDVPRLGEMPEIDVTTKGYEYVAPIMQLQFNVTKAPFDNPLVRKAIATALDRQFVIDNIWFGFGKPATGPIHSAFEPSGIFTTDGVESFEVDDRIAKANAMLDEAGLPRDADGIRFRMIHDLTPYGEEWRRFGEYVKQVLAELGIAAELRYEDVATWLKRVYTDYDYEMSSNWLYGLPDPVLGVHRQYHSNQIRPGTVFVNGTKWSSPETDALMDAASVENDPKKRAELYHDFQRQIVDASPIIFMHELEFTTVHSANLKNAVMGPLGVYHSFADAYFEQ